MVSHIAKVTVTLKVTSFSVKFVGFFFFIIVSFFCLVFFLNEEMFVQLDVLDKSIHSADSITASHKHRKHSSVMVKVADRITHA